MKKSLFVIAAMALAFVACDKPGTGGNDKPLDANLTLTTELTEALPYGQPTEISGTIETAEALETYTLTAVKKAGEEYVAVGEAQEFTATGNEMKVQFFADSKEMTDIEVVLAAGKKSAKFYFPATAAGELKGTVWMNPAVVFKAAPMIDTHDNNPEAYPEANTGAGCDLPSFFSMRGVEVNGEVKHVLSLTEARDVMGEKVSMSWVNVLQNTSNKAYIGGHRGFAFVRCNSLGAGTVGRQCDLYEVNGKKINTEAMTDNNFSLAAIRGSWAGDRYTEEEYKFVDKLFLDLKEAETNLEKMKAYWQLSQIQVVLDNATLGVEDNPTNITTKNMYRRYVYAGEKAKTTETFSEEFRAGDYFIIRTNAGTADAPQYLYGIIQVLQLYDDAYTFTLPNVNDASRMAMDKEKALDLFEKPNYFAIKTQCDL